MRFWEGFSFGRKRVLEKLSLSRKKAQEPKKFGNKIEAVNPPEVPPCARGDDWKEAKFRGMRFPLVKGGKNDRETR